MSESEQIVEGEVVAVEPQPVSVSLQPKAVRPARPISKALTLVGATLAFIGREIVPRVAASLLDAWEHRASGPTLTFREPDGRVSATRDEGPARQSIPGLRGAGGRRHRWRSGRG